MKITLGILIITFFLSNFQQPSKMDLLCHKWVEVGRKDFGKDYKSTVDNNHKENILIKKNGMFFSRLNEKVTIKGIWVCNRDTSKIAFNLIFHDKEFKTIDRTKILPTDTIVLLTEDTLVLGNFTRVNHLKINGYDETYYVREK